MLGVPFLIHADGFYEPFFSPQLPIQIHLVKDSLWACFSQRKHTIIVLLISKTSSLAGHPFHHRLSEDVTLSNQKRKNNEHTTG